MIVKDSHVNVQWKLEPTCKCGSMKKAFEGRFLFASRFSDDEAGGTIVYMVPMNADGGRAIEALTITFCPSCGDRVKAKREPGT